MHNNTLKHPSQIALYPRLVEESFYCFHPIQLSFLVLVPILGTAKRHAGLKMAHEQILVHIMCDITAAFVHFWYITLLTSLQLFGLQKLPSKQREPSLNFCSHVYWTGIRTHLLQWNKCNVFNFLYIPEAFFQHSASHLLIRIIHLMAQTTTAASWRGHRPSPPLQFQTEYICVSECSTGIGNERGLDGKHVHLSVTRLSLSAVI